jgi:hypothetical protein
MTRRSRRGAAAVVQDVVPIVTVEKFYTTEGPRLAARSRKIKVNYYQAALDTRLFAHHFDFIGVKHLS